MLSFLVKLRSSPSSKSILEIELLFSAVIHVTLALLLGWSLQTILAAQEIHANRGIQSID